MDSYRIDKKSSSIVHGPGKCHDVRRPRTSTTREMDSYRIGRKSSSIPLQESSPRSQAHHDDFQCPESENRVRAFDPHAHTHTHTHTQAHTHTLTHTTPKRTLRGSRLPRAAIQPRDTDGDRIHGQTKKTTKHRNDSDHFRCPEVGLGCIDQDPNPTSGHPNPTRTRTSQRLRARSVSRGRIRTHQNQTPNPTSGHPNLTSRRTSKRLRAHPVPRARLRVHRHRSPTTKRTTQRPGSRSSARIEPNGQVEGSNQSSEISKY